MTTPGWRAKRTPCDQIAEAAALLTASRTFTGRRPKPSREPPAAQNRHRRRDPFQFSAGAERCSSFRVTSSNPCERAHSDAERGPALRGRHFLNSKELVTTLTLLIAIAMPATIGVSLPEAASGIPTQL